MNYKQILNSRDEEIHNLKLNTKISKFSALESDYKQTLEDFNRLKDQYAILNQNYNE